MNRQREQSVSDPALTRLAARPMDRPVVMLHSGRYDAKWATKSLIAEPRAWYRYSLERGSELFSDVGCPFGPDLKAEGWMLDFKNSIWHDLRELLNHPDLPGRWIGTFSYDLCRVIEPGKLSPRAGDWPLVELAWCPEVEEYSPRHAGGDLSNASSAAYEGLPPACRGLKCDFTRAEYEAAVRRAMDYIAAGDVFQVNLAQRFTAEYAGHPRELFQRLATISPAWYGAYLELPHSPRHAGGSLHRALLSTSPELFLQLRNNRVVTRPIKGTRKNPKSEIRRLQQRHPPLNPKSEPEYLELLHSAKDTAELNMIVDLMRNDLGRVCAYGSVRVTQPRTLESHPTVHHGVATIEGDLHPTMDVVDLLRATLPGGSVTGAPKVRAMQIIDELEPVPRGPYCGAIGWLTKDELQLSVAIRTMKMEQRLEGSHPKPQVSSLKPSYSVSFSVGGGIVADSDPAAEYEETLTKAQAMMRALDCTA